MATHGSLEASMTLGSRPASPVPRCAASRLNSPVFDAENVRPNNSQRLQLPQPYACHGEVDFYRQAYSDTLTGLGQKLRSPMPQSCQSTSTLSLGRSASLPSFTASEPQLSSTLALATTSTPLRRSSSSVFSVGSAATTPKATTPSRQIENTSQIKKADLEVEVLVQQIRGLCKDRRSIRQEMEEADERCRVEAVTLRAQLSTAQARHDELQRERSHLQQLLDETLEVRGSLAAERLPEERERDVEKKHQGLHTRIEGLQVGCRLVDEHLATMKAEVTDYQKRIEQLCSEQESVGKEALEAFDVRSSTQAELEGVKDLMRQSFAETLELQDKFSAVDSRFERVIGAVELESAETMKELQEQIYATRRRSDKTRRRFDELSSTVVEKRLECDRQQVDLKAKDDEIQRLRDNFEEERQTSWRREEHFLEAQRRSLLDQSQEIHKIGGLMPVSTHERIMREQTDYYKHACQDLEDALEHQRRRRLDSSRRLRESSAARKQEQMAMQQELLVANLLAEQSALRSELLEAERQEEVELERCKALQAEVAKASEVCDSAESAASAAEDGCNAFARDLELASSRLGLLKDVLLGERRSKEGAQVSLDEARRRIARVGEASAISADSNVPLKAELEELQKKCQTLASHGAETQHKLQEVQASLLQLQKQEGELQAHLEIARKTQSETVLRLEQTTGLMERLSKQKGTDIVANRRKKDVALRLQSLLEVHADSSRSALMKLRWGLREEQKCIRSDLGSACSQWGEAFQLDLKQKEWQRLQRQEAAVKALEATTVLSERLRSASCLDLAPQVRALAETVSAKRSASNEQRAKVQLAASNTGRVIAALGASSPLGMPETARQLLRFYSSESLDHGSLSSPSELSGEMMVSLEAELGASLSAAQGAAVDEERSQCSKDFAKSQAQAVEVAAAQLAEVSEKRMTAARQVAKLSSELAAFAVEGSNSEIDSKSTLKRSEEHLKNITRRLQHAEAAARAAAAEAAAAEADFALRSRAIDEAVVSVSAPLESEIKEASQELSKLQRRFPTELADLEASRASSAYTRESALEAELADKQADLRRSLKQLQAELSAAREAEASAKTSSNSESEVLQNQLATLRSELAFATEQQKKAEALMIEAERGVRHVGESRWKVERQLSDLQEVRRQDVRDAEASKRDLQRQNAEELRKLKMQSQEELASMRATAGAAARGFATDAHAEAEDALKVHAELESKMAHLAVRARAQLGRVAGGGA
eukprot:TRINITY_DN10624_c0_g1_i1.p1 TRINITY_DN10624_c0_g1~~TRINITY_DN10624_c0_g1_i1.p1  ORF type:complete len:1238 (-),score=332.93 TRINITY_DN10624_c0_g1_i1:203-3916(-)